MKKKLNLETIKREQAFQLYRKLGSVKQIAELPGMPPYNVLLKWKEEDKWDERIEESKRKLQDWEFILSKLESDSLLKDDVMHLMLLNKLLEKTIYAIVEKDLEPQSWREAMETLKMIFEQKRMLLGRATSKTEIDIDFSSMDETEIRETLRKINEILQLKGGSLSPEEQLKKFIKEQNQIPLPKSISDNEEYDEEEELAQMLSTEEATNNKEEEEEIDIETIFRKK